MGAEEESGGAAGSAPSLDPPRMVRGGSYQLHTLTQPVLHAPSLSLGGRR